MSNREVINKLSDQELSDSGFNLYQRLRFDFYEDDQTVPIFLNGQVLDPEDWRRLSHRVERFYANVAPGWLEWQKGLASIWYWQYKGLEIEARLDYPINRKKVGWIYILEAGPYYKIGRSKNVDKRIEQLSTLPPFDIELVHLIQTNDTTLLEIALHNHFANKRKNGEWFELEEEDITWLKQL